MKKVSLILILLFLISLKIANCDEISVSAYVNKTEISLDETLQFTIEINSSKSIKSEPEFPQLAGLQIIGQSSSSSTSIEIINGKMSKSVTKKYVYTLQPIKIGNFNIPPITIKYKGDEYRTKIIRLKILASKAKKTAPNPIILQQQESIKSNGKKIFLEAITNKHKPFVGEPITVSYKLYSRENLVGLNAEKFPDFSGFIKEETYKGKSISSHIEIKNGMRYYCYRISEFTLFPTQAKKITIEPMILLCEYRVSTRSFFDFGRTEQTRIYSNRIDINVQQLPKKNKPADFSGAVGNFYINTNLSSKDTKVGESITLNLIISGTGNFKMFNSPKLPELNNINTFEPEISDNLTGAHHIQGKKISKYLLVPEEHGEYEIPEIAFTFFDTEIDKYRKIFTSPIKFTVKKNGKQTKKSYYSAQKQIDVHTDICFIKTENKIKNFSFIFYKFWYWLIICISFLLLAIAIIYKNEQDKLLQDRGYFRAKFADKNLQKDMKKIKINLLNNRFDRFFILAENALRNYISNRLNISEKGTQIKEIVDTLRRKKIDDGLIKNIEDFLMLTDQVRFSKIQFTKEEINSKFAILKQIISNISKIKFR
ncbi:MAG: protein BatD [Candidatus Cloacimonetes bacterium]|nr:protein BatD [Candidatus Cloacimonadota bacterium]